MPSSNKLSLCVHSVNHLGLLLLESVGVVIQISFPWVGVSQRGGKPVTHVERWALACKGFLRNAFRVKGETLDDSPSRGEG